jgi:hypothetical protein
MSTKTKKRAVDKQRQNISDENSLMDELTIVHNRIQNMIARYLNEDDLSDKEWEEFWELVDRKVQLIEAETQRELAETNARLNCLLEDLQRALIGGKTSEPSAES